MDDSDSSTLSSPPLTEDEVQQPTKKRKGIAAYLDGANDAAATTTNGSSPAKRKRPASPPHETVLADNMDIAIIVMFRSRFTDAFPAKCPHVGPQDIERGIVDQIPSPQVEALLCALLGLVLNRKKPVEKGHYGRALEEAIQTQKGQWPRSWNGVNPLHGGRSFNAMGTTERLDLLKTFVHWSLTSSEQVQNIIKEQYKQSRKEDDTNQPMSVQPWGQDGDKRKYYLIEGQDDTNFRIYREKLSLQMKVHQWISVAGSIDEVKALAEKLQNDGSQAASRLAGRMLNAVPRFEATEEKRRRREYRLSRKAQFSRPIDGVSLYEGRTRGVRKHYNVEEEDDFDSDTSGMRSTRRSGRGTPAEHLGPTVTASGRQVRSRFGGTYGETLTSAHNTDRASPATGDYRSELSEEPSAQHGRATRAAGRAGTGRRPGRHIEGYNSVDELEDEDDAESSGHEWNGDENNFDDDNIDDDADADEEDLDEDDEDDFDGDQPPRELVVTLRYPSNKREQVQQITSRPKDESKDEVLVDAPAAPPPVALALQQNGTSATPHPATAPTTNGLRTANAHQPTATPIPAAPHVPQNESLPRQQPTALHNDNVTAAMNGITAQPAPQPPIFQFGAAAPPAGPPPPYQAHANGLPPSPYAYNVPPPAPTPPQKTPFTAPPFPMMKSAPQQSMGHAPQHSAPVPAFEAAPAAVAPSPMQPLNGQQGQHTNGTPQHSSNH